MHDPYRALYLHLPFCVKRCSYCDFATAAVPAESPQIDEYVEDLCLQIRRKSKEGELGGISTVYLGGGTRLMWACRGCPCCFTPWGFPCAWSPMWNAPWRRTPKA